MISEQELINIGEAYGIGVTESEAGQLRGQVEKVLVELDPLDELELATTLSKDNESTYRNRTWDHPSDDPYNSLAVQCHVPPETGGILDGIQVGVKDNISVASIPLGCASEVMQEVVPKTDATVVKRMLDAGATIKAKTNLDEFAGNPYGITGDGSPLLNPYDSGRTPGGSSGGSAAAVATGNVDLALGTDTGGSVRVPAAFCGTVGLKPTYGLVPLTGVVENTYTLDHVGTLSTGVADSARILEAVSGKDPDDPASLQAASHDAYRVGGYVNAVENPPSVENLELGVLVEGISDGVRQEVVDSIGSTLDHLEDAGATIHEVSIDSFHYGPAIKNCLSFVEMAAHWRACGAPLRRGGTIDENLQTQLASGTVSSNANLSEHYRTKLLAGAVLLDQFNGQRYTRAQSARRILRTEFEEILDELDAVVLPTTPDVAPPLEDATDPGFDYLRNTRAANVTCLPAISLPDGTVDGLPVGSQLIGRAFEDDELLGVAERVSEYTTDVPRPRQD